METVDSGELRFENTGGSLLDCSFSWIFTPASSSKVLGVTVRSELNYEPWNEQSSYFIADEEPLVSRAKNVEIRASPSASHGQMDTSFYTGMLENQGSSSTSHLLQYQLDGNLAELVHSLRHLGNESFPEMNDFSVHDTSNQIGNSGRPSDYSLEERGNKMTLTSRSATDSCPQFQGGCQNLREGSLKRLPNGRKRKRLLDDGSQFARSKNMDTQQEKDEFTEEKNEKKLKLEQKSVANVCRKLGAEEVKGGSKGKEASQEDYIHVRAKRGQATNRHSLAERVRKERISERMKFLQDLVPGCNKITGKAVLLDEIVNYVLSLQRQVEFLSMKLATVYPEMSVDIEQILSRAIHYSQGGSAAILGDLGSRSFYPTQNEVTKGNLSAIQSSNLKLPTTCPMASIWYNMLPSTSQPDFISDAVQDNLESNGCVKVEL